MASGDQPAEIGVAGSVFDQADGTFGGVRVGDFRSHDGGDARFMAGRQEFPQAAEAVRVGEGQTIVSHLPGGLADGCR